MLKENAFNEILTEFWIFHYYEITFQVAWAWSYNTQGITCIRLHEKSYPQRLKFIYKSHNYSLTLVCLDMLFDTPISPYWQQTGEQSAVSASDANLTGMLQSHEHGLQEGPGQHLSPKSSG